MPYLQAAPPRPSTDPYFRADALWLLATYGAATAFVALLALQAGRPASLAKVWSLYRWGWALVPVAGLAAGAGWWKCERQRWPDHPSYYPLVLLAHNAAWLLALSSRPDAPAWPARTLLLLLALPTLALAALGRLKRQGAPILETLSRLSAVVVGAVVVLRFDGQPAYSIAQWVGILAAGAALTGLSLSSWDRRQRSWSWPDLLMLLGLLLLLLPWRPNPDLHHEGFYLGPVNDLLHGRTLLVDSSCQYGVGVVYFIAAAFKLADLPPSFDGLYTLDALLFLALFVGLYLVLRKLLRSRVLALVGLFCSLMLQRFGPYTGMDNAHFPSVGPLRFGPPLLLLAAAWWRRERRTRGWAARLPETLMLGITALWSLESLAYALAGYGALLGGEAWQDHSRLPHAFRAWARSLGRVATVVIVAHGLFAMTVRAWTGHWPDWSLYWEYLSLYSGGFGSLPFPSVGPWVLYAGLLLAGLVACLFALASGDNSAGLLLVLGLGCTGVVEFTYFVGRSHPDNLAHISLAAIVMTAYWLDRGLHSPRPRAVLGWALLLGTTSAMGLSLACVPAAVELENHAVEAIAHGASLPHLWEDLRRPHPYYVESATAATLASHDLVGHSRAVLLVPAEAAVEAHLLAGTCDRSPVADPEEDGLIARRCFSPDLDADLRPGDVIVLGQRPQLAPGPLGPGGRMQQDRYERLAQRFRFQLLAQGPQGVSAVRLVARLSPTRPR